MLYKVEAKYKPKLLQTFYTKLTDGTIASQKPDGKEILNAMKKAKITTERTIEWYEICFCDTPLKHERETVYDNYLYDFNTTLIASESDDIEGTSFWEYMSKL